MRVIILANTDPTSSIVFHAVCADPRLEVAAVAFTQTLTRSSTFFGGIKDIFRAAGLPYFLYIVYWNGVFRAKELLLLNLPPLRVLFPGFFSLRLWASRNGIPIIYSPDFNSPAFVAWARGLAPDLIVTRINQLLKRPLLESAPHGCWCFHSSELPRYRGMAAEFHSMLNGESTVGFSVMQMEPRLDGGALIAQGSISIPPGVTLHRLIVLNNRFATQVVRTAIDDLLAGRARLKPQDTAQKSYYGWPSTENTRAFRRKGLRFITPGEALAYLVQGIHRG